MDNSSRNIVKFIATITAAALLIMGARFYSDAQKEPTPSGPAEPAVATQKPDPAPPPVPTEPDTIGTADVAREEIPAITGEPSVEIPSTGPASEDASSAEFSD
jgi:hypothetical protein